MQLIDPAPEWRTSFLDLAREFREQGDERHAPALADFEGFLRRIEQVRRGEALPPGWVPGRHFWLPDQGAIVGCLRLRFQLNAELEEEGGHIGYDVRPSARRRGYGTALLGLGLEQARALRILRVRLTVDSDNQGSIKIIERHAGVLAGEAVSRHSGKPIRQYWITP